MTITGQMQIGARQVRGRGPEFRAVAPATGAALEPAFAGGADEDVHAACALAEAAFDPFRETEPATRARFLEAIAANLRDGAAEIVERCLEESGLPRARLEGELGRTMGQLRLFAAIVREGSYLDARIDPALPDRKPAPRVDLRLRNVPLGPVAVFGASNFPLAFSVAGGDTASALAAGCPVVAKAHNAHPGASELAGRAIRKAVADLGLPDGVFSLLFDADVAVGQALVAHPAIKAVGFTGSRRGGLALVRIAQAREEPIPVYAEMSSINPVVLMPAALAARGASIGSTYAAAFTLGAGQFCTNPGVVLAVDGPGLDTFLEAAAEAIGQTPAATMLTPAIHRAFCDGVSALLAHSEVSLVRQGGDGELHQGRPSLFATTAEAFRRDPALQAEVFGAASIVVRCRDVDEIRVLLEQLEGQLTIAVHADADDHAGVRPLLPTLERKAGRIVFNGFGTGVEVGHAMVHGGPYPATSDSRYTSVGGLAIRRFLRPVSYQDAPDDLLPPALRNANPQGLPRRRDGAPEGA